MNVVQLPTWPWENVSLVATEGANKGVGKRCLGWAVCLYAYLFTLAILAGASHGVTSVGMHLADDDAEKLNGWQWVLLFISVLFFSYFEALKGFHQSWSPWVVRRCFLLMDVNYLQVRGLICALIAPLFAMGFFFASRRRLMISYTLYPGIVILIVLVKQLSSPYHEIVDLGVAAGIGLGTLSFVYHFVRIIWLGKMPFDEELEEPLLA